MNTSALFWLSVISTGLASAVASWLLVERCVRGITADRAKRALWVRRVSARTNLSAHGWILYAAPVAGFLFALKAAWDGSWILALCFVVTGMMLVQPLRTWMEARRVRDSVPVTDLALVCIECDARDKAVLQILDESSATLGHLKLREIVEGAMQNFYNGATEDQVLRCLVTEQTNSVWGMLIWTLLVQQRSGSSMKLRNTFKGLMRERRELAKRARSTRVFVRRSVGCALILFAVWGGYLTITPASVFYSGSLQGQLIGGIALLALAWMTCVWSARLESIQRMVE